MSYESQRAAALGRQALDRLDSIAREGRAPTSAERREVDEMLNVADAYTRGGNGLSSEGWDGRFSSGNSIPPGGHGWEATGAGPQIPSGSPGDRFLSDPSVKAIMSGARPERWSTALVEVGPPYQTKGTVGEQWGGVPGTPIGGAAMVATPMVVPGITDRLFQPLTIEALLSAGVATGPTVRFVVEGTATSGAAAVGEGQPKPESVIGLTLTDEPVRKVATYLSVSEEIMEDSPLLSGFLNQRLSVFVQSEVERQLVRGTADGNEVQGLLTSRGVPVYTGGTAVSKAEQLFLAMSSMRGSALIEPEWTILNPHDYEIIRLLKDGAGQYFGGGPFGGQYGSGAMAGPADALWGEPTYVTSAVGPGTAIVGTTSNAKVWSRGGLRVEMSNSHDDYFRLNLLAVRAERRLVLTVFRASGFCECRFAVGPGG